MTKSNINKRSSLPEPLSIRSEGLDLNSEDSTEFAKDNQNSEESIRSAVETANLIPEINKFTLSSPYTLSSPLQASPHTFINNNPNNCANIRHAQIPINHRHLPHSHRLHYHNPNQMFSNLHRSPSTSTYKDIRNLKTCNRRQSNGILSRTERDSLIQVNLRRSEELRKQMQLIDYELFLITRNIQKLQNNE